ncbi:type I secretion system permease/ATPase [Aliiruegeria sabulilitoris]|uniref:type I secretion system permease/ATPase n=1 Tax=Aliiruegeria sabulilitoris TaxID=1510458 RepID=UPI00082AC144|nr:type I secretion system permease/ATPase [Aliiruegeria sabulilitoris]NDR55586.1 type I secretion system permease/ATPase [Pseudoruegeria sp. M32A2M]
MRESDIETGRRELRRIRRQSGGLLLAAFVFSIFVNMLMLTGPLYMLQIYDRVLSSRSEETLLALSALVVFLYAMMGLLDYARGRVMARIGARFQARLDQRVFTAAIRRETGAPGATAPAARLRDLENIQRFFGSPAALALFDLPWTPVFLLAIYVFHPWLGGLAICGGILLVSLTALNQARIRHPLAEATQASLTAERISGQILDEAETVEALGMRAATFERWQRARSRSLRTMLAAADRAGTYTAASKALRLLLQSAMLGLGAYLVLQHELTGGAMIAGSILLGRALAPVELAVGQWEAYQRMTRGWRSLSQLLGHVPPETKRTALPKPAAQLEALQATIIPPGDNQATLRMVSFQLPPGQAMGVIGPSGSGKTTLARALTGVWPCAGGKIRLDGAALEQYDPDVLGQHIGYLPQRIRLFDGTIAENIARLSASPDAEAVVAAARKADAHEMILKLPNGYDTPLKAASNRLSGGQIQRLGLARALYGDPCIVVLDEPNSNLDNEGSEALNRAIRQIKEENRSVIIMAHRPAAIRECDLLLVLDNGIRRAFGPRDEVLRDTVRNAKQIHAFKGKGGIQ